MESLSKNKIKWIRSLRLKKNRDKEQLFVVEGEKMVQEVLSNWAASVECFCTTEELSNAGFESFHVDERTLKEISALTTPNKYLAVVRKPEFTESSHTFILAIDGIQDPGNMGTILRTADWFKVDKIICSMETVDIFNPKVVQSSMGSIFRIPVEYCDLRTYLAETDLPVYGALLEGENVYSMNLERKGILVMGNEGKGISEEIKSRVQQPVHIPRLGEAESLNVSIATGILLSEFSR